MSEATTGSEPFLRVVKGDPTAEELAALIAVVSARALIAPSAPARAHSAWSDPRRGVRTPLAHGPSRWRRSALPR